MSRKVFHNSELFSRIEKIQREKGLNQTQMAGKMGISSSHFSMAKKGERGFGIEALFNLKENFTDVNIEWVLTGEGEPYLQNINTNELKHTTGETDQYKTENDSLREEIKILRSEIVRLKKSMCTDFEDDQAHHTTDSSANCPLVGALYAQLQEINERIANLEREIGEGSGDITPETAG